MNDKDAKAHSTEADQDREPDIAAALTEIATWYGPQAGDEVDREVAEERSKVSATPTGSDRPVRPPRSRLMLVASVLVVLGGVAAIGAWAMGTDHVTAGLPEATDRGDALRTLAIELCLGSESDYDLEALRADGSLHVFGDRAAVEVPVLVASDSLHLACVVNSPPDREPFAVSSGPSPHVAVGSSDVSVTTIVWTHGHAVIDDRWWGVLLPADAVDPLAFPPFTVWWTESTGAERSALGEDLVPSNEWSLCRADEACRQNRLVGLQEQAKAAAEPDQAAILADATVAEQEYRAVMQRWGTCIAEATGAEVEFTGRGDFVMGSAPLSFEGSFDAEFERCEDLQSSLVMEAVDLGFGADS